MKTKHVLAFAMLVIMLGVVSPAWAETDHGMNAAANAITDQIKALQDQVKKLQSTASNAGGMPAMVAEKMEACGIDRDLAEGVTGEDVKCLQGILMTKGLLRAATATGYFGSLTKEAVKAWQAQMGLPNSGFFGPLSRGKFGVKSTDDAMSHMDAHAKTIEVAGVPTPTLDLVVAKDPMDGWNVQLKTTNYTFAPEQVNMDPVQGGGHAHIYIDGVKLGRLYGPWYHLPSKLVEKGTHQLKVALNANNHNGWTVGGKAIEDTETIVKE